MTQNEVSATKNRSLTTKSAKRMTPQLHTSAFLPSYFSPCQIEREREREKLEVDRKRFRGSPIIRDAAAGTYLPL